MTRIVLPTEIVGYDDAAHRPFVLSSWIQSARRTRPWRSIDPNWAATALKLAASALLAQPTTAVAVAINPERHDQLLGWLCGDVARRRLHWIWVKERLRGHAVGSRLMARVFGQSTEPIEATSTTRMLGYLEGHWHIVQRTHLICEVQDWTDPRAS